MDNRTKSLNLKSWTWNSEYSVVGQKEIKNTRWHPLKSNQHDSASLGSWLIIEIEDNKDKLEVVKEKFFHNLFTNHIPGD